MKSQTRLLTTFFLSFVTLFILACQFTSPAATIPTSTAAFTFTPVATPTETPTLTPVPRPDISSAVLTLDDLPVGFEEFTLEELGMSMADFSGEGFQPEHIFVFVNTKKFQMILGFNFLLTDKLDRVAFDLAVSQPELTLPALVKGIGTENVRDEKLLEGMEDIGDLRIGMTMVANMQGLSTQVDVLMFRRDVIGEMIMSMTLEGQTPNITIHDLGRKLDQRVQDTLQGFK